MTNDRVRRYFGEPMHSATAEPLEEGVLVRIVHWDSSEYVGDVGLAGVTAEGLQRWVINHEVRNNDRIVFTPWPPPGPTTIMSYYGGTYRTLLTYRPEMHIDHWSTLLRRWRWDRAAIDDFADKLAHPVNPPEILPLSEFKTRLEAKRSNMPTAGYPDYAGVLDDQVGTADPVDRDALVEQIGQIEDPIVLWWIKQALDEASQTVAKAREYGSAELEYAGHVIGRIGGREVDKPTALELQIFHYVLGKQGRWVAAVTRGEPVSSDTLLDIGVYVRMVQYIREHGEWT